MRVRTTKTFCVWPYNYCADLARAVQEVVCFSNKRTWCLSSPVFPTHLSGTLIKIGFQITSCLSTCGGWSMNDAGTCCHCHAFKINKKRVMTVAISCCGCMTPRETRSPQPSFTADPTNPILFICNTPLQRPVRSAVSPKNAMSAAATMTVHSVTCRTPSGHTAAFRLWG